MSKSVIIDAGRSPVGLKNGQMVVSDLMIWLDKLLINYLNEINQLMLK